ncbi:MAG TPA: 30S ribosomal protein S9 [Candidatus Babeliales bacterium]|nr:30S ribosomal protein S9 [Candidatus Babeliales bacterium]
MERKKTTAAPKTKMPAGTPVSHGVGRRKSAVARVWLRRGNGKIVVNGKTYNSYFDTEVTRLMAVKPILLTQPATAHYDVEAYVEGGGRNGQAGAVQLGIARALVSADENLKMTMREHGMLTVDARLKERKKYGRKAARRGFQFVKR